MQVSGFVVVMNEYELSSAIINESFGGLRGKFGLKDANNDIS